jgi:drug/metabolite transporter (DMT)-like permease
MMMTDRDMLWPSLAVALSAVLWGLWWMPLRALEASGLTGDWASTLLFGAAALLMLPVALRRCRGFASGGGPLLLIGLLSGAGFSLWNHALITGDVVRVSLLFYLMPIWATGLALFMLGGSLRFLRLLSIILGLVGAATVLGFDGGLPLPRSEGEWAGLTSGILFAFVATLARKLGDVAGFEKNFLTFAFAAAASLLLAVLRDTAPWPADATVTTMAPLLGLCVLWIVPTTWLLLWGAGRLDPGWFSILLLLEIVTAAVSAAVLTDEPFGWRELAGCVLVIGAGLVEALDQARGVSAKSLASS